MRERLTRGRRPSGVVCWAWLQTTILLPRRSNATYRWLRAIWALSVTLEAPLRMPELTGMAAAVERPSAGFPRSTSRCDNYVGSTANGDDCVIRTPELRANAGLRRESPRCVRVHRRNGKRRVLSHAARHRSLVGRARIVRS